MKLADALLHPRSVAVVGASGDAAKTTGRPLRFLRQAGYAGKVYPVNPARDSVQGERAWPTIESLPETPDHAYVVSGTATVIDAVEACGRRGVKVATILASGFGEAGEEGARREARLREIVAATGIRVVGPSSLGVVNVGEGVMLTANAAFAEPELPRGSILVASHSGSMIGAIVSRGKARGVGFAALVSVGNEVDLSIGEICEATLDDPMVGSYLLFLETLRHADALRRFALAAAERGKAILAYKLGRSAAAAELAVTHTGALAGEDDVASAFLRECGIARVHTLDGLIEGLPLVSRFRRRGLARQRTARVGVVTTTGGGAAMVVDQLGVRGIDVQAPSGATLARLASAGIEVAPGRIVDLTLAGTKYAVMKAALDVLLTAPELDLVVAVPGSSARTEPELAVRPVIDSAGSDKPLAAFLVPDAPDALAMLAQAGVPAFRTPESCADVIAAEFAVRPRVGGRTPITQFQLRPQTLDELEAYGLLAELGIANARAEAMEAAAPATTLAYPVAVKALSADVAHKTDAGGVELDVKDGAALREAVARIRANVAAHSPGACVTRVLVQEMARGLGEALAGYRRDPQVGPIVILAAGGVLAELQRERAIRLAPVDIDEAREMIAEVRAFAALAGYRNRPRGDLEALARAVVALSQLADRIDVLEAEVNPLVILAEGRGVLAVDALAVVAHGSR